jgi:sterol desaturase/sphingolipid hydroxylase (fatty acid hydroxylase superfamily)
MGAKRNGEEQSFGHTEEGLLVRLASGPGNYWTGFVSDPLTVAFFLFWEATVLRSNPLALSLSLVAGLMSFSLAEYAFHRWVYHKGRTSARAGHKKHHESPGALIAMPWFIVTASMAGVWYLFAYRLRFHFVLSFMAGFLAGFVVYGIFHHVHHHYRLKNPWYRKLRAHHLVHHQHPEANFGVTSRFWDRVFGTMYRKEPKMTAPAARA